MSKAPDVTLIIPARNEGPRLKQCVEEMGQWLGGSPRVQAVIIVLDGCTDGSAEVLERCAQQLPIPWPSEVALTVLNTPGVGKAAAVALGLRHTETPFSLCWDADLEYRFEGLPAASWAMRRNARISGFRAGGLRWQSALANRLVRSRLASLGHGEPPRDVLTAVHGGPTAWMRGVAASCSGFALEAASLQMALSEGMEQVEVPVPYIPRTKAEGKMIRWWHLFPILRAAGGRKPTSALRQSSQPCRPAIPPPAPPGE